MKESEFIELLNLYLDHEISAADAVRLEAEVQNNPARCRVYQQYCRMQKACKLLTADLQGEAVTAASSVEKKVIPFDPAAAAAEAGRRRKMGMVYTFGTLAAAACVALIFVNRADRSSSVTREPTVQVAPAAPKPAVPAPAQLASDATGPRQLGNQRSAKLVTDPLLLSGNANSAPVIGAVANDSAEHLKWITSLQIAPLPQHVPVEDLRFDVRPTTLRPDARVLGGNRVSPENNVEMTAFRFVK